MIRTLFVSAGMAALVLACHASMPPEGAIRLQAVPTVCGELELASAGQGVDSRATLWTADNVSEMQASTRSFRAMSSS